MSVCTAVAVMAAMYGTTVGGTGFTAAAGASTFETPTITDTNYAIPSGALFVSTSGSDSNPGTQAAPWATLTHAVATAPVGSTIVMRGGTYRETLKIYRRLTIQPYPHEHAWLDGRQPVTSFTASGSTWMHTAWNPGLCETCYDPGVILPTAPAAGLPDMVFVDGNPLAQVTSLAAVVAGTFYVDTTNHVLYLGSNPAGHDVEATVYPKAIELDTTGPTGSVIRGIGFIGYGSNWSTDSNSAMVIANAPNITLENDTFAWDASRGVAMLQAGGVVRGSTFLYNGFQGLLANTANGLVVDSSRFAYSNEEHFVYGWSSKSGAAGLKVTSSTGVTIRDSTFDDNAATGLWFDVSSQNVTVVRNLVRQNLWDGISVEIGDTALVASNLIADNGAVGMKVSGFSNVRLWNNTMANNGTAQLGVYEDPRSNPNAAQRALGITWDTANVSIHNNVMASDDGKATLALLHTWDGNSPKKVGASQMISGLDNDMYARSSTAALPYQAEWATLTAPDYETKYTTLAQFHSATGDESQGLERVNYTTSPLFVSESTGNYHLVAGSPASGTGHVLATDVAAAIGVSAGVAVDRGALLWPDVSSPPVNPTLATPVYGLWNHTTGDRIYTTSASEVSSLSAAGYTSLGAVFHASSAATSGTGAVYRLLGPTGEHLYTPATTERDKLVGQGWTSQGTAFYAPTASASGLVPVYRLYDTVSHDHYLSTSATVPTGSTSDGLKFWAAP